MEGLSKSILAEELSDQLRAYACQQVEAWRERAITIVCAGHGLGSHTTIQEKIADAIRTIPVEPA